MDSKEKPPKERKAKEKDKPKSKQHKESPHPVFSTPWATIATRLVTPRVGYPSRPTPLTAWKHSSKNKEHVEATMKRRAEIAAKKRAGAEVNSKTGQLHPEITTVTGEESCKDGEEAPSSESSATFAVVAKELFGNLPPLVKARWKEAAEREYKEAVKKWEEEGKVKEGEEERRKYIETLPQFLDWYSKNISEDTGCLVSLIAGGPESVVGGKLSVVAAHQGHLPDDPKANFGVVHREEYEKDFLKTYGSYLSERYSQQGCVPASVALPVVATVPNPDSSGSGASESETGEYRVISTNPQLLQLTNPISDSSQAQGLVVPSQPRSLQQSPSILKLKSALNVTIDAIDFDRSSSPDGNRDGEGSENGLVKESEENMVQMQGVEVDWLMSDTAEFPNTRVYRIAYSDSKPPGDTSAGVDNFKKTELQKDDSHHDLSPKDSHGPPVDQQPEEDPVDMHTNELNMDVDFDMGLDMDLPTSELRGSSSSPEAEAKPYPTSNALAQQLNGHAQGSPDTKGVVGASVDAGEAMDVDGAPAGAGREPSSDHGERRSNDELNGDSQTTLSQQPVSHPQSSSQPPANPHSQRGPTISSDASTSTSDSRNTRTTTSSTSASAPSPTTTVAVGASGQEGSPQSRPQGQGEEQPQSQAQPLPQPPSNAQSHSGDGPTISSDALPSTSDLGGTRTTSDASSNSSSSLTSSSAMSSPATSISSASLPGHDRIAVSSDSKAEGMKEKEGDAMDVDDGLQGNSEPTSTPQEGATSTGSVSAADSQPPQPTSESSPSPGTTGQKAESLDSPSKVAEVPPAELDAHKPSEGQTSAANKGDEGSSSKTDPIAATSSSNPSKPTPPKEPERQITLADYGLGLEDDDDFDAFDGYSDDEEEEDEDEEQEPTPLFKEFMSILDALEEAGASEVEKDEVFDTYSVMLKEEKKQRRAAKKATRSSKASLPPVDFLSSKEASGGAGGLTSKDPSSSSSSSPPLASAPVPATGAGSSSAPDLAEPQLAATEPSPSSTHGQAVATADAKAVEEKEDQSGDAMDVDVESTAAVQLETECTSTATERGTLQLSDAQPQFQDVVEPSGSSASQDTGSGASSVVVDQGDQGSVQPAEVASDPDSTTNASVQRISSLDPHAPAVEAPPAGLDGPKLPEVRAEAKPKSKSSAGSGGSSSRTEPANATASSSKLSKPIKPGGQITLADYGLGFDDADDWHPALADGWDPTYDEDDDDDSPLYKEFQSIMDALEAAGASMAEKDELIDNYAKLMADERDEKEKKGRKKSGKGKERVGKASSFKKSSPPMASSSKNTLDPISGSPSSKASSSGSISAPAGAPGCGPGSSPSSSLEPPGPRLGETRPTPSSAHDQTAATRGAKTGEDQDKSGDAMNVDVGFKAGVQVDPQSPTGAASKQSSQLPAAGTPLSSSASRNGGHEADGMVIDQGDRGNIHDPQTTFDANSSMGRVVEKAGLSKSRGAVVIGPDMLKQSERQPHSELKDKGVRDGGASSNKTELANDVGPTSSSKPSESEPALEDEDYDWDADADRFYNQSEYEDESDPESVDGVDRDGKKEDSQLSKEYNSILDALIGAGASYAEIDAVDRKYAWLMAQEDVAKEEAAFTAKEDKKRGAKTSSSRSSVPPLASASSSKKSRSLRGYSSSKASGSGSCSGSCSASGSGSKSAIPKLILTKPTPSPPRARSRSPEEYLGEYTPPPSPVLRRATLPKARDSPLKDVVDPIFRLVPPPPIKPVPKQKIDDEDRLQVPPRAYTRDKRNAIIKAMKKQWKKKGKKKERQAGKGSENVQSMEKPKADGDAGDMAAFGAIANMFGQLMGMMEGKTRAVDKTAGGAASVSSEISKTSQPASKASHNIVKSSTPASAADCDSPPKPAHDQVSSNETLEEVQDLSSHPGQVDQAANSRIPLQGEQSAVGTQGSQSHKILAQNSRVEDEFYQDNIPADIDTPFYQDNIPPDVDAFPKLHPQSDLGSAHVDDCMEVDMVPDKPGNEDDVQATKTPIRQSKRKRGSEAANASMHTDSPFKEPLSVRQSKRIRTSLPLTSTSISVPITKLRKAPDRRQSLRGAVRSESVANTSLSASVADPSTPQYFKNAIQMFTSSDAPIFDPRWNSLVNMWSSLEAGASYTEVRGLGKTHRPQVVGDWIARARSATWRPNVAAGDPELKAFEVQFRKWWVGVQPAWRVVDEAKGKLSRDYDEDQKDLEVLRLPGKNGIVSVVAALFYWGVAVQDKSPKSRARQKWVEAMEDCHWVFEKLVNSSN